MNFKGVRVRVKACRLENISKLSVCVVCEHFSGDVIIAQSPEIPEQFICKRITAVQGDTMKTRHSWYKSYKVHLH